MKIMSTSLAQIPFRYRETDTPTGVSRDTAKRLASVLGLDETQTIHLAMRQLADKHLPRYEADNGMVTARQLERIRRAAGDRKPTKVKSSLF
jgi:hypothetical protein